MIHHRVHRVSQRFWRHKDSVSLSDLCGVNKQICYAVFKQNYPLDYWLCYKSA